MKRKTPLVPILLVGMTALAGYNYLEITRLKGELTEIKAKVHYKGSEKTGQPDLLTELAVVKQHTAEAKNLIASGQVKRARLELDKSLKKLDAASKTSQDIASGAARGLGVFWVNTQKELEDAWKEVSVKSTKARSGGNGSAKKD